MWFTIRGMLRLSAKDGKKKLAVFSLTTRTTTTTAGLVFGDPKHDSQKQPSDIMILTSCFDEINNKYKERVNQLNQLQDQLAAMNVDREKAERSPKGNKGSIRSCMRLKYR
jgi:hypothetical protein